MTRGFIVRMARNAIVTPCQAVIEIYLQPGAGRMAGSAISCVVIDRTYNRVAGFTGIWRTRVTSIDMAGITAHS
jgi:hypothetical protein